jgi:flagellar FliL protein
MGDSAGKNDPEAEPKSRRKGGFVLLLGLAGVLGAGAFAAVYTGFVTVPYIGSKPAAGLAEGAAGPDHDVASLAHAAMEGGGAAPAFVPLDPLVISLGSDARARHLKVTVQIEVASDRRSEVEGLKPRIVDVLNTFLRAVDESVLEEPRSMARLRAQMVRRVQLVTPVGAVRDVLVQEFVLN